MSLVQDAQVAFEPSLAARDEPRSYSISAEVFLRMLDAEVFPDEARIELWDGQVVEKMAKKNAHAAGSTKAMYALFRGLPEGYFVSVENPLRIGQTKVPLPDLVVQRGSVEDLVGRPPTPEEIALVVEVADSSLRYDSGEKLAGYAQAGIPAYWVINLVDNVILVFEQPNTADGRYAVSQTIAIGQSVPLRLDGVLVAEIPAVDLLPVPR